MRRRMDGRRCYDHLGGRLGAGLLTLYLEKGWLEAGQGTTSTYRLTESGRELFGKLGLPPEYLFAGEQ